MASNEDIIKEAEYYLSHDVTNDEASKALGISKRSFQLHMKKLAEIAPDKYKLVQDKISMQVKGDILVVAGDIDEDINRVSELLYSCSKYYKKVIFALGNHEYYIPVIKYIYTDHMAKEYNYNSMNKVYRLNEIFKDNKDIIILDKTNNTKVIIIFFISSTSY